MQNVDSDQTRNKSHLSELFQRWADHIKFAACNLDEYCVDWRASREELPEVQNLDGLIGELKQ